MKQKEILAKTIAAELSILYKFMADRITNVLPLAKEIYLQIPDGKWKTFFDQNRFDVGVGAEPPIVFLKQNERLYTAGLFQEAEQTIRDFYTKNFNRLIESLFWLRYSNIENRLSHMPAVISIEIPEDFTFTKEELASLQKAFEGYLRVTRSTCLISSDKERKGSVTLLVFQLYSENEI